MKQNKAKSISKAWTMRTKARLHVSLLLFVLMSLFMLFGCGRINTSGNSVSDGGSGISTATNESDLESDASTESSFSSNSSESERVRVSYRAEEGGYVDGETEQAVEKFGTSVLVIAVADEGYDFVGWSDGVKSASRKDYDIAADFVVTAKFAKRSFSVYYQASAGGRVEGKTVQIVKWQEDAEPVTAEANAGYAFIGWSDGVTANPRRDVDIRGEMAVTALFEKQTFSVIYEAEKGGQIVGEAKQTVKWGESSAMVTAKPKEGYEFFGWSDGVTEATRVDENIKHDERLIAKFTPKEMKVFYKLHSTLGEIINTETEENVAIVYVPYGEDAPEVKAVPKTDGKGKEYVFMYWSDGVETAERHDKNVTSDLTVTAYFGYRAEYKVDANRGGRIGGNSVQEILPSEAYEEVEAIPDLGYIFVGWSDLNLEEKRLDADIHKNIEYIAYFEPIKKTFRYDYGTEEQYPVQEVVIDRFAIAETEFVVPSRKGYVFGGWYADKEYRVRITAEDGRYMYGYAVFTLESDTLYARWHKEGETKDSHKILLIFVDEASASFYSYITDHTEEAYYKMSMYDYRASKWVQKILFDTLNKWFSGEVEFEVDSYYTIQPVENMSVTMIPGSQPEFCKLRYRLFADEMEEVGTLQHNYHNTLVTVELDDEEGTYNSVAGNAVAKNGCTYFEMYWGANKNYLEILEGLEIGDKNFSDNLIDVYLHELAHTAYRMCKFEESDGTLHFTLNYFQYEKKMAEIEALKLYFLNEAEIDGSIYGIPKDYWLHRTNVRYNYVVEQTDASSSILVCSVKIYGEGNVLQRYICGELNYGGGITVEAVAAEGYRFLKWTDGVTTAVRHDIIISYVNVQAIFEKI